VNGWVWWELIPCDLAVEWSLSGLCLDLCSLTEAACSGQKPEHMCPRAGECGTGGIAGCDQSAWDGCRRLGCRCWCHIWPGVNGAGGRFGCNQTAA